MGGMTKVLTFSMLTCDRFSRNDVRVILRDRILGIILGTHCNSPL
jgi:hypothetical protein